MPLTQTTSIGEQQIIAITDGHFQFEAELFPGTDESHIQALLANAGTDSIQTNFNAFVIKSKARTMLVDAGPRDLFGPTCGKLPDALAEAGIAEQDISHLMLTHLHPDHIAGAITADGEAVFKNATLMVNEDEVAFWNRDETFGDDNMDQWQQMAKAVLAAYGERMELFAADADLGGGVTSVALPGHTPGHSGFRVVQIADPDIAIAFDIDADTARDTRKRILDMVATDGIKFTGGHLMSPKFARIQRAKQGYKLESA